MIVRLGALAMGAALSLSVVATAYTDPSSPEISEERSVPVVPQEAGGEAAELGPVPALGREATKGEIPSIDALLSAVPSSQIQSNSLSVVQSLDGVAGAGAPVPDAQMAPGREHVIEITSEFTRVWGRNYAGYGQPDTNPVVYMIDEPGSHDLGGIPGMKFDDTSSRWFGSYVTAQSQGTTSSLHLACLCVRVSISAVVLALSL